MIQSEFVFQYFSLFFMLLFKAPELAWLDEVLTTAEQHYNQVDDEVKKDKAACDEADLFL